MEAQPHPINPPKPGTTGLFRFFYLAWTALFVLILYTFLHEGGHAVVGSLFGGRITEFNVDFVTLSAHVGINGEFTRTQNLILAAAGVSLPLLIWTVYMLAVRPRDTMAWFNLIVSMAVLNSLLAWIVIPILVLAGQSPGDDSTNFLYMAGVHPLIVTAAALLVYLAGWVLFVTRMGGFRKMIADARTAVTQTPVPETRRSLVWMLGLTLLMVAVTVILNNTQAAKSAFQPPSGYGLAAQADLSQRSFADESVLDFTLDQPDQVRFFFLMENIQSGPVEIYLTGPDGYEKIFARFGHEFKTGKASVHTDPLDLTAGAYSVRLTFPQTGGRVTCYSSLPLQGAAP